MGSTPPPLPPNRLDYSGPMEGVGQRRRRRWIDWSMGFSCISAAVAVTVVLLVVVPQVEGTFQSYGVKLPAMTVLLLKFSKFCRAGGIVAVGGRSTISNGKWW